MRKKWKKAENQTNMLKLKNLVQHKILMRKKWKKVGNQTNL